MEEKDVIKITDENGVEKEVEVINFFTLNSNGKKYMTYTENEEDAKGNVIVYTAEVVETEDEVELVGITDPKVLEEVKEVMIDIVKMGE